jgi:y4mF family transcriptional regulator
LPFADQTTIVPVREQDVIAISVKEVGVVIRESRKRLGVTQKDLALTSGTGLRFIIELEKGKDTCQIGKVLTVIQTLGIRIELTPPAVSDSQ